VEGGRQIAKTGEVNWINIKLTEDGEEIARG